MRPVPIVGIGAGGHAKVILDVLTRLGGYEVVGLTDVDPAKIGTTVLGFPVVGDDTALAKLRQSGVEAAFVGVGAVSVHGTHARAAIFDRGRKQGFVVPTLVHPDAVLSSHAAVGEGTVLLAGAAIGAEARLGMNVTVYSGSVIEHDCVIGDHAHLSPGVLLAGGVAVGEGSFLGIGAVVAHGVRIGPWATVGAGAVVLADVAGGRTVVGVPARDLEARVGSGSSAAARPGHEPREDR